MPVQHHETATFAVKIANTAIAGGSSTAMASGFLGWFNEWAGFLGFCVALTGLAVNIYFKVKADRRARSNSVQN